MGTFLWYFQRFTAVIILIYVLFILFSYMVKPWGFDYNIWHTDITSLPMKVFTTIFFISSIVHGIQGLRDVEDDYFTKRTLSNLLTKNGYQVISITPYWQSLSLKYVLLRASKIYKLFKIFVKIVDFLGIGNIPFSYYIGQTKVLAQKKI